METDRLIIRRFTPGDSRDLYEYLSDEEVVRFEPYGVFTKKEAEAEAARRARDESFWAVCLKENNKLIGNMYFCQTDPPEFQTWELGYVFNRLYGHKGYATEAAVRIVTYGFSDCGAHRITAYCSADNTASWKLLERIGMRREGHFLQRAFFKYDETGSPRWQNVYAYALLADEWKNR